MVDKVKTTDDQLVFIGWDSVTCYAAITGVLKNIYTYLVGHRFLITFCSPKLTSLTAHNSFLLYCVVVLFPEVCVSFLVQTGRSFILLQ